MLKTEVSARLSEGSDVNPHRSEVPLNWLTWSKVKAERKDGASGEACCSAAAVPSLTN